LAKDAVTVPAAPADSPVATAVAATALAAATPPTSSRPAVFRRRILRDEDIIDLRSVPATAYRPPGARQYGERRREVRTGDNDHTGRPRANMEP
jgi:hypothetical protein